MDKKSVETFMLIETSVLSSMMGKWWSITGPQVEASIGSGFVQIDGRLAAQLELSGLLNALLSANFAEAVALEHCEAHFQHWIDGFQEIFDGARMRANDVAAAGHTQSKVGIKVDLPERIIKAEAPSADVCVDNFHIFRVLRVYTNVFVLLADEHAGWIQSKYDTDFTCEEFYYCVIYFLI